MSEVRLVVREEERDWSGTVHGSTADRAIAALAADPVSLAELEVAFGRFEKRLPGRRFLGNLRPGFCDEPYDAGIVIIDLVARLIVVDSSYSFPSPSGQVDYHDSESCTRIGLPYHLADDWLLTKESLDWTGPAEERRDQRRRQRPRDNRQVFYGAPLLEFIARETFAAFDRFHNTVTGNVEPVADEESELQAEAKAVYDTLRQIHAAWLLTPRNDLGAVSPRDVALEQREHLSWDLQDQEQRWSFVGECPPGIDPSSEAFRSGGFGTHELVMYYDLVRELLWSCWEQLTKLKDQGTAGSDDEPLSVDEFVPGEISRLESVRDEWLETPQLEHHERTPRSIIDRERARLPEGMSGEDAIIDPDCPCCQMLADMPGPMFWHLDGSAMDDDFAFDIYHTTREEWEAERREWQEHSRRFDAEQREKERLGMTNSESGDREEHSIWSSSYSVGDAVDVPIGVRLFGIGGHLAELIVDLRRDGDDSDASTQNQIIIDRLNRDFGNLRALFQSPGAALAEALIQPVIDRFAESLSDVACDFPVFAEKCDSLHSSLVRLLEPRSPAVDSDDGNSEVPF